MAKAVGMVIKCPRITNNKLPVKPMVPTAKPNRRNRIAPRMVEIAVIKTGAVPNLKTVFLVLTKLISKKIDIQF